MHAGTTGLRGARDGCETFGSGPTAVEADERVASVDRDRRTVEELLDRESFGRDAGGLADLQRPLGRSPLVRTGADQLEQTQWRLHAELDVERRLDRSRHVLERLEASAERAGKLRQPQ